MAEYHGFDVFPSNNLNRYITSRDANSLNWRPHFAVFPVKLASGGTAWFEIVYKRKTKMHISHHADESPGHFTPVIKFKEYQYITEAEHLIEVIKDDTSLFSKAQEILRSEEEGVFDL